MWRWMFGFKEDSSIPVGAAYKGDGLYNLYCLGCSSNYSSEASMLLHDWVSQCFLYFHHAAWQHFLNEKFFTTERIYFTALWTCIIIVFCFNLNCNLKCLLSGLIEIIESKIYSFYIDMGFKLSTLRRSV